MPISYDKAFGGLDERMRDPAQARSYCQFQWGVVGIIIFTRAGGRCAVSNTEEINHPVRDPGGSYRPMASGPIGRGWPSRIGHAGTYDQTWIDNVFPFCQTISMFGAFKARRGISRSRTLGAANL